jgi:Na+/proline symporter
MSDSFGSTSAFSISSNPEKICYREFPPPDAGVSNFAAWDYVVFCIVLLISLSIGLYHAFAGGRQRSTKEFLFADKSMSALPVALSVFASFFSASTILGTPAEVYQQGTMYWMCVWGAIFAPIVGAFVFGPFFNRMSLTSVYEVGLQKSSSHKLRLWRSLKFLLMFKLFLFCGPCYEVGTRQ